MSQTFQFDDHFQNCYLAFVVRDPGFCKEVIKDIEPEMFTSGFAEVVCRITKQWVREHETPPGQLLYQHVRNLFSSKTLKNVPIDGLSKYIDKLFAIPLQNRRFLLHEHNKFFKHQQLQNAYPKIREAVEQGDFDLAQKIIQDVVTYRPERILTPGVRMQEDPVERIKRRLNKDQEYFLFGIPEIDERIPGVQRGTLNVFQSQRSSAGKTTALVHMAKTYVMQGKKVLIFTTEDGEAAYQDKLDMSVCGIYDNELVDSDKIRKCMKTWFSNGGDIYIKGVDCMSATVGDLRDFATFIENTENFKPDCIILDYADELIASKNHAPDPFNDYRVIYGLLRGWAQEENLVIWTAAQSNRSGTEGEHADMGSMGLSIAKTWIPDMIVTINRNSAQEEDGETDLFFAKYRQGYARWSVVIKSDLERGRFYTNAKAA